MKQITLPDFLTPEQIEAAVTLWRELRHTGRFASELDQRIITPNMASINEKLGQENNSRFLAYAVEYVLIQSEQQHGQAWEMADDVCAYCGVVVGHGVRALHLGVCEACAKQTPKKAVH